MRVGLALALIAVAFAGCSENSAPVDTEDSTPEFDDLEATADTGIIRGVVVDASIVPIAGATVTIDTLGVSAETTENGAFGFDGLEPGAYFMTVSKLGYNGVQTSADVVAGDNEPPVLKVILDRDLTFNPYASTQQYTGFYQCGTSVVVVCAAPKILLEFFGQNDPIGIDTSTPYIYVEEDPTFVQTEMSWETTQTLSPSLYFQMEALDTKCPDDSPRIFLADARGESPLRANVNETWLEEGAIGGPECGIYHSVFSGDALSGAHCAGWPPNGFLGCPGVGFSVEQQFEWFTTEFHGFVPHEDWWYIVDGSISPPS